ncbi:spidroin-2-like [Paramacrobiotus metropolitanus]|uniref:spidroin-2-like n=1 Tax=Paramacrobiotus metropolitanus TaxID=2943436 RepID=UPI0024460F68|nr:spidroin-2-like [Paramacrobiotus metropolitanus]
MPALSRASLFFILFSLPCSLSSVLRRDFSLHAGRLRRSPDLIYADASPAFASRGNFFQPSIAGRADLGDDTVAGDDNSAGDFKTNAISYDRPPAFLSLRSLAHNKQSLVGFGAPRATTTAATTTTTTTTEAAPALPKPQPEGKSDVSFIPANNDIPFIRQVAPPSFAARPKPAEAPKDTSGQVQTAPAVFGGPSNNADGFVNPAAALSQQQPPSGQFVAPQQADFSSALTSNNVDASGFIPAHPAPGIAGRQDMPMLDPMNPFGGAGGGQFGGQGGFGGQGAFGGQGQDPNQFGMPPQGGFGGGGQSPNFFGGADTANPQFGGGSNFVPGADQFTSQQVPSFGGQNNIFQQVPLPNNPGQFDQFTQGGVPGQFPQQTGADASQLAPLDPALQGQQPLPPSQFDPQQQQLQFQQAPQFQQPSQFQPQFPQAGFGQPDGGQPNPAASGQFMQPKSVAQFNPNAASDGMFIPVSGQGNPNPNQNAIPASQPQPLPEQSRIQEQIALPDETTPAATEPPKPADDTNAAAAVASADPNQAQDNQENPGEAQQRAFFDAAPMPGNPAMAPQPQIQGRELSAQAGAQALQQPSARDAYGASGQPGYAGGMAGPAGYSGGVTNYVGSGGYGGGGGYTGGTGSSRYSPFLGGIGGGTGFGYPSGGAPYPYGAYGGFGYGYRPYYLGYNYDLAPYGIPQPTDFLLYGKNTLHPEKTYYLKGATDSAASGGTRK